METIPIPDAVTVGLGWDNDHLTDYDLLAAAYSANGQNLGFIQGTSDRTSLFGKAITHTGDNDGTGVDTVLGDSENIIFDLRAVPPECTQILFGSLVVTPPHDLNSSRPYLHMLPMMREETIKAQIASGGTRTIQYEDSDDEDSEDEFSSSSSSSGQQHGQQHGQHGTRGINDDDDDEDDGDDRHKFVKLFHAELAQYNTMIQQKGFVAGKIFRYGSEWHFTPYRTVVTADPQYGIWPALDYYATADQQQQQQQSNQSCYQQQQQPPSGYGSYPPQNYVEPFYQQQQQQQQPYQSNYGAPQSYGQAPPGYGSQPYAAPGYDQQQQQQPQQPGFYYPQ